MGKLMFALLKNAWMRFAHILGRINTTIILTIFYVLVIGLVAVLSRLAGLISPKKKNDGWKKKVHTEATTQWASHLF